ncbi:histidine-type phosphatase [uncultured Methylobacterium sp.]|jgi:4-phytase/acid phosphatase|uniref:histidine-type phosphatase n=1 Tax=uncultured Methylobacterium sp. TaxID=157278 RepID=UPI002627BB70|nr:histidine-type phosphatase [uncultured Methylobacterium sp.]
MIRPLLDVLCRSRLLGGLALAGAILVARPAAALVLDRVVLVQRHGVRAPTQSPEALARFSERRWPTWPVGAGELTPKGAEVVGLVADAIRAGYAAKGLLPAQGCPGEALVVWADGRVSRTRESGRVMADRLAPGCGLPVASRPDGDRDPVFDSFSDTCRLDRDATRAAITAAFGSGLTDPATDDAVRAVWAILRPGETPGPSSVTVKHDGVHLEGALGVAAPASEIMLLEYAEGLPPTAIGWGLAATPARIAPLLAARNRGEAITARLPAVSLRRGAAMARLMLATLAGETQAADPAVGPGTRLLALAGHDTNLVAMAGVFGVDWTLPGQPDRAAPATAFALEGWRDEATGERRVGLSLWYAELDGLRALDPATVHAVPVPLPGCEGGLCPLGELHRRILSRIPAECGQ